MWLSVRVSSMCYYRISCLYKNSRDALLWLILHVVGDSLNQWVLLRGLLMFWAASLGRKTMYHPVYKRFWRLNCVESHPLSPTHAVSVLGWGPEGWHCGWRQVISGPLIQRPVIQNRMYCYISCVRMAPPRYSSLGVWLMAVILWQFFWVIFSHRRTVLISFYGCTKMSHCITCVCMIRDSGLYVWRKNSPVCWRNCTYNDSSRIRDGMVQIYM